LGTGDEVEALEPVARNDGDVLVVIPRRETLKALLEDS